MKYGEFLEKHHGTQIVIPLLFQLDENNDVKIDYKIMRDQFEKELKSILKDTEQNE